MDAIFGGPYKVIKVIISANFPKVGEVGLIMPRGLKSSRLRVCKSWALGLGFCSNTCMYVCIYIYIYICVCVCVHTRAHTYTHVVCPYVSVYALCYTPCQKDCSTSTPVRFSSLQLCCHYFCSFHYCNRSYTITWFPHCDWGCIAVAAR